MIKKIIVAFIVSAFLLNTCAKDSPALRQQSARIGKNPFTDAERNLQEWLAIMRKGSYREKLENILGISASAVLGFEDFSDENLKLYKKYKDEILDILIDFVTEYKEDHKYLYGGSFYVISSLASALYTAGQKELFSEIVARLTAIKFPTDHTGQIEIFSTFLSIISLDTTLAQELMAFLIIGILKNGYYINEDDSHVYFDLIKLVNSVKNRWDYYLVRTLSGLMLRESSGQVNVLPTHPLRVLTHRGELGQDIIGVLWDRIHRNLGSYCVGLLERMIEYYRRGDVNVLCDPEFGIDYYKGDSFKGPNIPYPEDVRQLRKDYDITTDDPRWHDDYVQHRIVSHLFEELPKYTKGDTDYERLRNISDEDLSKIYAGESTPQPNLLPKGEKGWMRGSEGIIKDYIWVYRVLAARYNRGDTEDMLRKIDAIGRQGRPDMNRQTLQAKEKIFGATDIRKADLYIHLKNGELAKALQETNRIRAMLIDYVFSEDIVFNLKEQEDIFELEWWKGTGALHDEGGAYFYDTRFNLYRIDFYLSLIEDKIISEVLAQRFGDITDENVTDAIEFLNTLVNLSINRGMASLPQRDYSEYLKWQDTTVARALDVVNLIIRENTEDKNYIKLYFGDILRRMLEQEGAQDAEGIHRELDRFIRNDNVTWTIGLLCDNIAKYLMAKRKRWLSWPKARYLHKDAQQLESGIVNRHYLFGKYITRAEIDELLYKVGRGLLGAKGIGLIRALKKRLNIPAGFILPSGVFARKIKQQAKQANRALKDLEKYLEKNQDEEFGGCKFADKNKPLLISIRPGAFFIMPGQMATITNVGISEENIPAFTDYLVLKYGISKEDAQWTAWDCYRRFLESYAVAVYGMNHETFDDIIESMKARDFEVSLKEDLSAEQMKLIALRYKKEIERTGKYIPQDLKEIYFNAVRAARKSYDKTEAYRRLNNLTAQDWPGAAVTAQVMALGNLKGSGFASGVGVAYSRGPNTGKPGLAVEYKSCAQGEDIAKHTSEVEKLDLSDASIPWLKQLKEIVQVLDDLYGSIVEVEFTVENGALNLLQIRHVYIPPKFSDFIFSPQDEGLLLDPKSAIPSSGGAYRGLAIIAPHISDMRDKDIDALYQEARGKGCDGLILIVDDLSPQDIPALIRYDEGGRLIIGGILTKRGGMTSHSSDIARAFGMSAIVGIDSARFTETPEGIYVCFIKNPKGETKKISDSDILSINGANAIVCRGKLPVHIADFINGKSDIAFDDVMQRVDKLDKLRGFIKDLKNFIRQTTDRKDRAAAYMMISEIYLTYLPGLIKPQQERPLDERMQITMALDPQKAIDELESALILEPDNKNIYTQLAMLYEILTLNEEQCKIDLPAARIEFAIQEAALRPALLAVSKRAGLRPAASANSLNGYKAQVREKFNAGELMEALQVMQDYYTLEPRSIGGVDLAQLCEWLQERIKNSKAIEAQIKPEARSIIILTTAPVQMLPDEISGLLSFNGTGKKIITLYQEYKFMPVDTKSLNGSLVGIVGLLSLVFEILPDDINSQSLLTSPLSWALKGIGKFYIRAEYFDEAREFLWQAYQIGKDAESLELLGQILGEHSIAIPATQLKQARYPTRDEVDVALNGYTSKFINIYDANTGEPVGSIDRESAMANAGCLPMLVPGCGVVWIEHLESGGFIDAGSRMRTRDQLYPAEAEDKKRFEGIDEIITDIDALRLMRVYAKASGKKEQLQAAEEGLKNIAARLDKMIEYFPRGTRGLTFRIEAKHLLRRAIGLAIKGNEPAAHLALMAARERIAQERTILLKERLRFEATKSINEDANEDIIIRIQHILKESGTTIHKRKTIKPFQLITMAFRFLDHAIDSEAKDRNKMKGLLEILQNCRSELRRLAQDANIEPSEYNTTIKRIIAGIHNIAEELKGAKLRESKGAARRRLQNAEEILQIASPRPFDYIQKGGASPATLKAAEQYLKEANAFLMDRVVESSYIVDSLHRVYIAGLRDVLRNRNRSVKKQIDDILELLEQHQYENIARDWLPQLLDKKYVKLEPGLKWVRFHLKEALRIINKILEGPDKDAVKRLRKDAKMHLQKAKARINEVRAIATVVADYRDLLTDSMLKNPEASVVASQIFNAAYQQNLRYLDYMMGHAALKRLKLYQACVIPERIDGLKSSERIDNPLYLAVSGLIDEVDSNDFKGKNMQQAADFVSELCLRYGLSVDRFTEEAGISYPDIMKILTLADRDYDKVEEALKTLTEVTDKLKKKAYKATLEILTKKRNKIARDLRALGLTEESEMVTSVITALKQIGGLHTRAKPLKANIKRQMEQVDPRYQVIAELEQQQDSIKARLAENPLYHRRRIEAAIGASKEELLKLRAQTEQQGKMPDEKRHSIIGALNKVIEILGHNDIFTSVHKVERIIKKLRAMLGWAFREDENARAMIYATLIKWHLEPILNDIQARNRIIEMQGLTGRRRDDPIFASYRIDCDDLTPRLSQIQEQIHQAKETLKAEKPKPKETDPELETLKKRIQQLYEQARSAMDALVRSLTLRHMPNATAIPINSARHYLAIQEAA